MKPAPCYVAGQPFALGAGFMSVRLDLYSPTLSPALRIKLTMSHTTLRIFQVLLSKRRILEQIQHYTRNPPCPPLKKGASEYTGFHALKTVLAASSHDIWKRGERIGQLSPLGVTHSPVKIACYRPHGAGCAQLPPFFQRGGGGDLGAHLLFYHSKNDFNNPCCLIEYLPAVKTQDC